MNRFTLIINGFNPFKTMVFNFGCKGKAGRMICQFAREENLKPVDFRKKRPPKIQHWRFPFKLLPGSLSDNTLSIRPETNILPVG
jgi:hypothetical protein